MWIKTEFAVPKKPYRVLVKIDFGDDNPFVDIAEYWGDGKWAKMNGEIVNVVAWQMLPE